MPELPEVETIKNELSPWIVGQSFTDVSISDRRLVSEPTVEELEHRLTGQITTDLERRGKYLIFRLSGRQSLVMHLRMTGALLLNPQNTVRYSRASFRLSNGVQLVFKDQRRFGLIWLVEDAKSIVSKLGPEPLSNDFTPDVLGQMLARHHIPVKAMLLDQHLIAGIGNMYADEALFAARIHPQRRADSLSLIETRDLHHAIRRVLRSAISSKGASVDTYVRPEGQLGTAQFNFKVAHRNAQPCPDCGTLIQRTVVQNRGSYFCPRCQPATPQTPASTHPHL
ncbi:MAG: bifunctional DNA-formamidopyrimidine glycosylase/DNA-(apurinic or apyrimidinic site) lyase [Chloroflexota bacterium]|nr:bifunctional DNA-formamidopyrimidine glycosylase/DNA-(apurinic or apyrimidinic site) lyase [Chloroflexota bacterium]